MTQLFLAVHLIREVDAFGEILTKLLHSGNIVCSLFNDIKKSRKFASI